MGYHSGGSALPDESPDLNFMLRHWRGQLSLPVSWFLVGGLFSAIAINVILLGVSAFEKSSASMQLIATAWLLFFVIFLAVRTWAAVGIWRSAGNHKARGGSAGWAIAARLILVVGVVISLAQASNYGLQVLELVKLAIGKDSLGRPAEIIVGEGGSEIQIKGTITQGTAERFTGMADRMPRLAAVQISSFGGRILEAQRIAEYIRQRKLNTRVSQQCDSACTLILVAGRERSIQPLAIIGFHQPQFPGATAAQQQAAIRSNTNDYLSAGIDRAFVDRVMSTPASKMWYPSHEELIEAGVITSREAFVGSGATNDQLQVALVGAAAQINDMGPRALDDSTQLVNAEVGDSQLILNHKILRPVPQIKIPSLRSEVSVDVKANLCGDALGRRLVQAGATVTYRYATPSGDPLFDISVTNCD